MRFPLFIGLQSFVSNFSGTGIFTDLVAGIFTGIISATINQPIDVIKTNMQGLHFNWYNGVGDCIS